jgi:hypothetical protein
METTYVPSVWSRCRPSWHQRNAPHPQCHSQFSCRAACKQKKAMIGGGVNECAMKNVPFFPIRRWHHLIDTGNEDATLRINKLAHEDDEICHGLV